MAHPKHEASGGGGGGGGDGGDGDDDWVSLKSERGFLKKDVDTLLVGFLHALKQDPYVGALIELEDQPRAPTPRFVVIGQQSSGKSTVVDRVRLVLLTLCNLNLCVEYAVVVSGCHLALAAGGGRYRKKFSDRSLAWPGPSGTVWQLCGLPLFCRQSGQCTRFPLEVTVLVESDDDFETKKAMMEGAGVRFDNKHTAFYTLCGPGEGSR
jgi:hypothetical protein